LRHYEENKEQIINKHKIWIENNKEYLSNYSKNYSKKLKNTKYECICGWIGNCESKKIHLNKSKKHQEYINSNNI